jgi:5-methylcytosine-specific restriction endonuclease McrA
VLHSERLRFWCLALALRATQKRDHARDGETSFEAGETRHRGSDEPRNRGCIIASMTRSAAVRWNVQDGASDRDWVRAHAALTRLARERAAADAEEGRCLLVAWRSGAHVHLGFGSFAEYVERLLGYSPRATREKLRVAEALEALPESAHALEQGTLTWCAARELTRVATADTEVAWLEAAHGKTTRELERLVAGRQPGEPPPLPTEPLPPRRHVLRFEVAPETFALFSEATQSLRRAAGAHLDDDALLLMMARHVLGAPSDERSSYRISFQVCSGCGQGSQVAGGELVPVGTEIVAMATCDGERLGVASIHPANENHSAEATEPVVAPTSNTAPTSSVTHVAHVGRTRQAVPPALRRAVLARDHHRCQVPGCTNSHFVDVHHIRPRSEGGRNVLRNLITLCTAHHRAAHRGELIIEKSEAKPDTPPIFRHADGTLYGQPLRAESADKHAKIFSALRHLGFREREVQAVLAELSADASLRDAPTAHLLRETLRRIRPAGR